MDSELSIAVTILRDGGNVYQETHSLIGGENTVVSDGLPDEGDRYELAYTVDEATVEVVLPGDVDDVDGDCVNVDIRGTDGLNDVVFYGNDVEWSGCE